MNEQVTTAAERVRAYLDEMDRINAIRPQYADEVHGINDCVLARSDVRAVLDQPQRVQPSREDVAEVKAEALREYAGALGLALAGADPDDFTGYEWVLTLLRNRADGIEAGR